MAVTIKKIAEYAGVSVGTVSRALNNDPLIALKTREKIRALASELDYVPNNIGKGLQSNKSYLLGYLISNIKSSFYDEILQGIGNVVCKKNYGLLTGITNGESQSEMDQLRILREKSADGIIVSNYQKKTEKYLRKIHETGVPLLVCDAETFDEEIPMVKVDDLFATELIMNHLYDQGHRSFAYYKIVNENSLHRYQKCIEFCAEKQLPAPVKLADKSELEQLLSANNRPGAVICYSDLLAIETIQLVRQMKLDVPRDLSVTGFDDIDAASWPEFNLSTIYQPKMELGSIAAELLIDAIENGKKIESKIIAPELVVRNSTGKV
jgi:DNA-binding LacI/PurR family transcriptional regulator